MKTNPREILIYYNPTSSSDRKTVAYAKSISPFIKSYAHSSANCTSTIWHQLLIQLNMDAKSLFNKALPEYQQKLKGCEFDEEGWLNVLKRNPHLMRAPIAIRGNRAILCESPTDILRL
jgi:arsenate reductase (glutaredoxin)